MSLANIDYVFLIYLLAGLRLSFCLWYRFGNTRIDHSIFIAGQKLVDYNL